MQAFFIILITLIIFVTDFYDQMLTKTIKFTNKEYEISLCDILSHYTPEVLQTYCKDYRDVSRNLDRSLTKIDHYFW